MKSTKTTYLVRIALLMAITIVLAATPLGYIPAWSVVLHHHGTSCRNRRRFDGDAGRPDSRSYLWCNEFYQSPYGGSGAVDLEL